MHPDRETCARCGAFVAKEPLLQVRTTLSGDNLAGREMVLRVILSNPGNAPTESRYHFSLPEPMEDEISGDGISVEPSSTVERAYNFVPPRPGQYTIPEFEVSYTRTNGEEKTVKVPPVNFRIDGTPVIKISLELKDHEVKLGEEARLYVTVINKGTAPAKNLRFKAFTPPTIHHRETDILLPSLQPDEERTCLILLTPLFDGEHTFEIRSQYHTPATHKGGPELKEISSDRVTITVKKN